LQNWRNDGQKFTRKHCTKRLKPGIILIMAEIINIFTGKEIKRIKSQEEIIAELHDDMIKISQHIFDCIDEELYEIGQTPEGHNISGLELRDENLKEGRDALVIVNLLYSMLLRFKGEDHGLQKDMDRLYVKLKAMKALKRNDTEIAFEPDFITDEDYDDTT